MKCDNRRNVIKISPPMNKTSGVKHRKRSLIGIAALLFVAATFAACGASSGGRSPTESSASYAREALSDYANEQTYFEDYEAQDERATPLPLMTPYNSEGSKIVYTVDMQLQTTTFEEGTRNVLNVVNEMGGYVQSTFVRGRNLYDYETERYAIYHLRIPSEKLATFLVSMEDSYNLLQLQQDSQDITAQYSETDSQAGNLKEQEQRLLEALELAENTDERLALERELAQVQAEISRKTATIGAMDSHVIYSTVKISLFEVAIPEDEQEDTSTFGERLNQTSGRSWDGFVAFCQGLLLFLIAALPAIIVIAAIGAVAFLIWRQTKKMGKKFSGQPVEMSDQSKEYLDSESGDQNDLN